MYKKSVCLQGQVIQSHANQFVHPFEDEKNHCKRKKTTGLILYEGAISRNENTRIHLREPPKTSSALVVVPMKN